MTRTLKLLGACSTVSIAMLCSAPAFAAGTAAGTDISNTVTVNYRAGSINQTAITATDTFKVDRKIIFSLTEAAPTGTTSVTPGQTGQVTRFQVTNTSNDTLDFLLTASQQATGTNAAHTGQDAFDVTAFAHFIDVNGNGTYEVATDTATGTIDGLAADASRFIFVIGNIPLSATNGQIAGVQLSAAARNSDGTAITAATDSDVNAAGTMETVFADAAKSGIGGVSAARDGIDVATDSFTVSAPALTILKTSRIINDLVSTGVNQKALPNATVEYCISVTNAAGAATASTITISDILPANLTFVAGSIFVNTTITGSGPTQTCTAGTAGGTFTVGTNTVSAPLANIAGGAASGVRFQATIN